MTEEFGAETSFTRIEEDVRRYWHRSNVPEQIRLARYDGPVVTIYQQPLVVAGQSWAEQVHLLAATDLMARYRAMKGDDVHIRAGWSCHGLPVEYAVEQSLGPYEADFDLAKFNRACHEVAVEGAQQIETLARWMGLWLDPAGVYTTMTPQAIGRVWKALHQLWDAGRLRYEGHTVPTCPRCATPLSETEAARRSVEVEAPSIWVQLPWDGEPGSYILAWTPLPWTLLGMVALAAHPDAPYLIIETVEQGEEMPIRLLLAEAALDRSLDRQYRVVRRLTGKSLRGSRFHPPFTFLPLPDGTGRIVLSTEIPLDLGTGLAPVTPAFDSLSSRLAMTHGLPNPTLMDEGGKLDETITPWRGLFPLESEPLVIDDLRARGLLFRIKSELQPQALCPYCETPLVPQPQNVWLLETASGPWFVGRNRAWGTPLPVWICHDCGETTCLAGLDDLAHRTGLEPSQIDPHRPTVDRLSFSCAACDGTMQRVSAVMDAAFEEAVLPAAPEDPAVSSVPGQGRRSQRTLAIGLVDKHIGWLGDLTEATALLYGTLAWEQAVVLPEAQIEAFGDIERTTPADALRWATYAGSTPTQAEQDVLRPLWQFVVRSQDWATTEKDKTPAPKRRRLQLLDRWLAACLHQTIVKVTDALNACDIHQAVQQLTLLVDDITSWYVPYGREGLDEVPSPLLQILAPFIPHLAEAMHRQTSGRLMDSGHLAEWPQPDYDQIDEQLLADMAHVRRLAALGQAVRDQAAIVPTQPLRQALVGLPEGECLSTISPEISALLAEALNVRRARIVPSARDAVAWNLALRKDRVLQRGVAPGDIMTALGALETETAVALVSQVWDGLSIGLKIADQTITLLPDEVAITPQAPAGWAAATDGGYLILLELD